MTSQVPAEVTELSPSAKLVAVVLAEEGQLTQQALRAETRLSQRTVRNALKRLDGAGVLTEAVYPPDARQSLYGLTDRTDESVASPERGVL